MRKLMIKRERESDMENNLKNKEHACVRVCVWVRSSERKRRREKERERERKAEA